MASSTSADRAGFGRSFVLVRDNTTIELFTRHFINPGTAKEANPIY